MTAEVMARRDSLLDYLPGDWQQAINTSPVVNALSRMWNRPASDLGEMALKQYGTPDRMNLSPLERRERPPWLDYDIPENKQIVLD